MAYYGYRGKDSNGVITVEYNWRIPRQLGIVYTGTSDGNVYIPQFVGRIAMFQLLPYAGSQTTPFLAPVVSISGAYLYWSFPWASAYRTAALISYGILG